MSLWATLQIALHALRLNMLRSGLTMLGIVIGVAAVIIMVAIGGGAQARIEDQIKSLGSNLILVMPGATTSSGVRIAAGSGQNLTEDDAIAIGREIDGVQAAAPTYRGSGQLIAGGSNWASSIQGVTPEYFEAREWPLADGRIFEPVEIATSAKVAIVGRTVAQQLFGGIDPLGQMLRINNVPFTVIGVLESKGNSIMGHDQDDIVLVPVSTARNRLFGNPQGKLRRVSNITVKVREGVDMTQVEDDIRSLMRQRQRTQADQDEGFTVRNLSEMLAAQETASKIMTGLLAAVASISLLVGGIGIMNIMLVSVTERTREIGLRMAVGAKPGDILKQFLVEALTLSLIGGAVGIALGALGAWLVTVVTGFPAVLSVMSVALATGFSAAIGVFFGFYPARKASKLLPIQALRYE
jgi:putative ABC transport system permease protein